MFSSVALGLIIAIVTDSAACMKVLEGDNGRIRGLSDRQGKDFVIAAILPIHTAERGQCTANVLAEAVEFVDAFLYSIDLVNNDSSILPNLTLGFDIRDSCSTSSTTIEEAVDLVLLSNPKKFISCNLASEETRVSAIIGEYISPVSIPLANFLQPLGVPQISFSATSSILSNREEFSSFYRTIPSDNEQAQAMIDLALYFGWTYISTIHSNDDYGEPGIDVFINLAKVNGICIDLNIGINSDFSDEQYNVRVKEIYNSSATVIVLFSSLQQVQGLFNHLQLYTQKMDPENRRKFLWIGSDAWVETLTLFATHTDIIAGMWGTIPTSNTDSGFREHFSQQAIINSNTRNPWFIEFYKFYYNCSSEQDCIQTSNNSPITSHPTYQNNSVTPLLIDAVYTFVHSLDKFLHANCDAPLVWNSTTRTCTGQVNELNGLQLGQYFTDISFTSPTGNKVEFDENGNIKGKYAIVNYQLMDDQSYKLVNVGIWNKSSTNISRLKIDEDVPLQFSADVNGNPQYSAFQSNCGQCSSGHVRNPKDMSCCGSCMPCLGGNYSNVNSSQCEICPDYSWGNNPLTGSNSCQLLEETYLQPSDAWAIALIIIACLGCIAVTFTVVVMVVYWNTPIMKSSGREQMIMLLIGIAMCFLSTVFFIAKPSLPICLIRRISLWLCFAMIICALFVKLVRIARIFLYKDISKRPRFIEPQYQVIFTLLLVGIQLIISILSVIIIYPEVRRELQLNTMNTNDVPTLNLLCVQPHTAIIILQILLYSTIIIASNGLAMLTIRFPANFKEVRYVAFSTFSIGIIWIALIVIYFSNPDVSESAIVSLAIQTTGLSVLICTFFHRMMIMIFQSHKNIEIQTAGACTATRKISAV